MPKVTIYTQVYNAKQYVEQCVSSVLGQTFTDFQYILVDSASTDGSSEILDEFAARDSRIKLIRLPENQPGATREIVKRYANGTYYTILDHDDWWEPDFLESLLKFAGKYNLDVACTGTRTHFMGTEQQVLDRLPGPLILDRHQFPDGYILYYKFFRTRWNKLMRMDYVLQVYNEDYPSLPYGGDTVFCLKLLRHVNRIGVDSTVLHHYRAHSNSQSHQYNSKRFASNVYCYQDGLDFLSSFGPVREQNLLFMQCVYANAVKDTIVVIRDSSLSASEKMSEYRTIAEHPVTREIYRQSERAEDFLQSRDRFWQAVLRNEEALAADSADFEKIVEILSPRCSSAVGVKELPLFVKDEILQQALINDDRRTAADRLLSFMKEKRYVKQYDMGKIFHKLLPENSPLFIVEDYKFFAKYAEICRMIFEEKYLAVLDQMTELLTKGKKLYDKETFLRVYLILAALENQASAFVFGKIRLAELYQQAQRSEDCLNVIAELEEMGAGENPEVAALRHAVQKGM